MEANTERVGNFPIDTELVRGDDWAWYVVQFLTLSVPKAHGFPIYPAASCASGC